MKVGRLENQSRILEEKLEEETKLRDTFEEKYKEVRDKVEIFDSLEEKMYRFEREKKEIQFENEKLEDKLLNYESVKKEKDDEILELKQQREEIESKYDKLRRDKEALVAELTTKFTVLEKQRMTMESNIRALSKAKEDKNTKCEELSSKPKAAEERIEKLKQRTSSGLERKLSGVEKEKEETERENLRLKRHNENIQKTCEDLASKLSKAYADMEKYKAGSIRDDADELSKETGLLFSGIKIYELVASVFKIIG